MPHSRNHLFTAKLDTFLKTSLPNITTRSNVKWSKVTINGVPTGMDEDHEPYSPEQCHTTLATENPAYATPTVTQKPSWIRHPSSYSKEAVSSLTVAFENLNGNKPRELLSIRQLYLFGARARVKKWKQLPPKPSKLPTARAVSQAPELEALSEAASDSMQEDPSEQPPPSPIQSKKRTLSITTPAEASPSSSKGKKKRA